jgi:hypothetical protein
LPSFFDNTERMLTALSRTRDGIFVVDDLQ